MEVTRAYEVHGIRGHRQRESFYDSYKYDWSEGGNTRILEVLNSDKTGTNEYSVLKITRNTADECEQELEGQLIDGIFENSRVGEVREITAEGLEKVRNTKVYKLFAGGFRPSEQEFVRYCNFETLKQWLKPDEEREGDDSSFLERYKNWFETKDIDDLMRLQEEEADGMALSFRIEEV